MAAMRKRLDFQILSPWASLAQYLSPQTHSLEDSRSEDADLKEQAETLQGKARWGGMDEISPHCMKIHRCPLIAQEPSPLGPVHGHPTPFPVLENRYFCRKLAPRMHNG